MNKVDKMLLHFCFGKTYIVIYDSAKSYGQNKQSRIGDPGKALLGEAVIYELKHEKQSIVGDVL